MRPLSETVHKLAAGPTVGGVLDDRHFAVEPDMASVHVELEPLERQLGVLELGDVDFDDAPAPRVGGQLDIVDEGGVSHRATVESIEPGRYGRRFRLRFADPTALSAAARAIGDTVADRPRGMHTQGSADPTGDEEQ